MKKLILYIKRIIRFVIIHEYQIMQIIDLLSGILNLLNK